MKAQAPDAIWEVTLHEQLKTKDALLIEGLPGIGNVGKVVVDYLIEHTKAKRVASLFSYTLPNTVFVNEENLVDLPRIEIYHVKIGTKHIFLMTGDVQPSDEVSSYLLCEETLKLAEAWNVTRIITLGGIGLQEAPLEPAVYTTGNDKEFIRTFSDAGANPQVYGLVGPIIGVSGLLLGLAKRKGIPAAALLAETLGHPTYLGLRGAKAILAILVPLYSFPCTLDDIDEEIIESEEEEPSSALKRPPPKLDAINRLKRYKDMNYIG